MREIFAPDPIPKYDGSPLLFLTGSIEMGKAGEWQKRVIYDLSDRKVTILNPRRYNWDSSWKQSPDNPQFTEQVTWELNGLDNADIILFNFDENTQSPITLMELGTVLATTRYAAVANRKYQEVIICCPEKYFRYGNVFITCAKFGRPVITDLKKAVGNVKMAISKFEFMRTS
jgi:hypothetical protein